jgi:hypothetical protein
VTGGKSIAFNQVIQSGYSIFNWFIQHDENLIVPTPLSGIRVGEEEDAIQPLNTNNANSFRSRFHYIFPGTSRGF